jgi:hypothetical protein
MYVCTPWEQRVISGNNTLLEGTALETTTKSTSTFPTREPKKEARQNCYHICLKGLGSSHVHRQQVERSSWNPIDIIKRNREPYTTGSKDETQGRIIGPKKKSMMLKHLGLRRGLLVKTARPCFSCTPAALWLFGVLEEHPDEMFGGCSQRLQTTQQPRCFSWGWPLHNAFIM